jgi:hypothetical protein
VLRAFWHLSGDDLSPALAGFAHDGSKPELVLRLRRLHGGGATPLQEIPLYLRGPSDQGEQVFSVAAQPARYDAELGLSDTAGGWVMLARSNALDHAARVDVRLVPVEPLSGGVRVPIDEPAPPASPEADALREAAAQPSSQSREPRPAAAAVSELPGIRAIDGLARRRVGLGIGRAPETETGRAVENLGASDPTRRASVTPPEPPLLAPAPEGPPSPQPHEGTAPPPALAERRSIASPSAPLRYGHPAPGGTELSIEVELRINGCAAPGSEIDLFGHPYRVGPGGRFQLVIRVDDRDLIKRAFELNPPNLPDRPTDV